MVRMTKIKLQHMNELFKNYIPCDMNTLFKLYKSEYHLESDRDIKKAVCVWVYNQSQKTVNEIYLKCQERNDIRMETPSLPTK